MEPDEGVDPREEFRDFFSDNFMRTVRMVLRMVPDEAEAEDVAAEAFARAYAVWARVRNLEYRGPWVLRVATNVAADAMRSHYRREKAAKVQRRSEDWGSLADEVAVRQALAAALRRLPKRQREAICLHYLAELSVDEVAGTLGLASATVKTHLRRGIVNLRQRVGGEWEEKEVAYDGKPRS